MKYLGFLVTHNGVKLIDQKIQAIKNMKPPTSRKEGHHFIGVVNYCRDIWSKLSHMLAPLANIIPSQVKCKCNKMEQDAFDETKRIVARDNLLAYPVFNKELKIHTNARDSQLGAFIIQKCKPAALHLAT